MKTTIAAIAACIAMAASAAPQKIAEVQFADKDALVAAATKFGELTGNASAGSMCVMMLSNASEEFGKCCGNSRLAVFADKEGKKDADEIFETAEPRYEPAPALAAGCVMKASVTRAGMAILSEAFDKEMSKNASEDLAAIKEYVELVKSIASAGVTVSLTGKGLDLDMTIDTVEGSELAKTGLKKFSVKDPFAGAGTDALAAVAYAADSGSSDIYETIGKIVSLAAKYGISTKWLAASKNGRLVKAVIDLPALVQYLQTGAAADFAKLDGNAAAQQDIKAAFSTGFKAAGPEQTLAFGLKGARAYAAPSQRFAKTLPEAASLPGFGYAVCSYYSLVKNIAEQVSKLPAFGGDATLSALVSTLPPDAGCDIASVSWREGSAMRCLVRANPAEMKGLSSAVMAGIAYVSQKMAATQSQLIEGDED